TVKPDRPVVLRLPLPLRQSQRGAAQVQLIEPSGAAVEVREIPGRVELRVGGAQVQGPIIAELVVEFVGGEPRDAQATAAPIGAPVQPMEEIWLRDREGLIVQSPRVAALAASLADGCGDARGYVQGAWRWLMSELRFGDRHRADLDAADPLGGLLRTRLADCILGSSLLIALF